MKTEFELTLNDKGEYCIKFSHFDKNASLEQKILGQFVKKARASGIKLTNPAGTLCSAPNSDNTHSRESYEIVFDDDDSTKQTSSVLSIAQKQYLIALLSAEEDKHEARKTSVDKTQSILLIKDILKKINDL